MSRLTPIRKAGAPPSSAAITRRGRGSARCSASTRRLGGSNRAAWSAMAHEPRTTAKVDLRSAAGSPSGIVTAAPTPWTLRPTQSSPCCWRTWPNTYCFRCLAAKLQVSEKDIRDSVQLQVLASQLHIRRRRCAECGHEDDLLQLAK